MDQLFSVRDGQVLTMRGWMPEAVVERERQTAEKFQNWGLWVSIAALFLGFFLVLAGIGLGLYGNQRAKWCGGETTMAPIVLGLIAGVGNLLLIFVVLPSMV